MVRDHEAAPPSKIKRLAGYFDRWRYRLTLAFSRVSNEGPRELAELQLRLSNDDMTAVVCARARTPSVLV